MNIVKIHLNLLDAGGSQAVVNATTGYVNANTGETTAFGNGYTLDPGLKEYYDTDLLENSRDKRYYCRKIQNLPLGYTIPNCSKVYILL